MRKLAAILAADVVGYSRLMGEDETGTLSRLKIHLSEFIEPTVGNYRGRIFKLMGDGVLIEFSSVVDALECAVAIQRGMIERNSKVDAGQKIVFRIGINLGDVIIDDDDIYGTGVNVAARLETLANPGGICLSDGVFDQVEKLVDVGFEYMGPQSVKNIDKPVNAYKVQLDPGAAGTVVDVSKSSGSGRKWVVLALGMIVAVAAGAWYYLTKPDFELAYVEKMANPLPDKPSVAVLPFSNLSAETDQAYFSDGITEDIITDLSKISGLFVVARNSSFKYKEQDVPIRQVAEELGVRHVLKGSVRRADDQIRITTQLVDALNGNQIWAERYDRKLRDIFSVQSEVARQVAKAMAVTLKANENERLFQKYTTNIDAYDVFLQARRTVDVPSKDNIFRGENLFGQVIELDPNFAGGYAGLSFNLSVQIRLQYSDSPIADIAHAF